MKMVACISLMCWIYIFGTAHATYQRWIPDTNFENPKNWNQGRAPCGNDVVIIPDESPTVYMQVNTTVKEMVLPRTGEIILGPNSNIGFTQNSDPKCPPATGDVEFTAVHPKAWFDPSSWCASQTEQGSCDTATSRLDVEKVPCAFDDVVMPRGHSYYIDLSEGVPELSVKSLKIAGSSFTSASFATFMTNQAGKGMFKTASQPSSTTQVKITRKACDDKRGCACGNDQLQIFRKICTHVQKSCDRPHCSKTIEPMGACCRLCGAVLNMTRGYGYDHEAFRNLITTTFYTPQMKQDVNMTLFLTHDGNVQLSLNDKTGEKSADLARQIKKDIDRDLSNGGHKYAISGIELMLSTGNPLSPSAHSGGSMSDGSVAGVVIATIIFLIIIAVLVVCLVFKRTGREMPKIPSIPMPAVSMPTMPSLPRLPRRMPKATARVPAQPHTAAHVDPGFANPLYDTSPFDDGNSVVKEMEIMASSQEEQPTFGISAGGGFNNPLYEQQGAMFDDPTKASSSSATKTEQSSKSAATGSAKGPADLPSADTSAKMVLVDINDDKDCSTI